LHFKLWGGNRLTRPFTSELMWSIQQEYSRACRCWPRLIRPPNMSWETHRLGECLCNPCWVSFRPEISFMAKLMSWSASFCGEQLKWARVRFDKVYFFVDYRAKFINVFFWTSS
jgi:hypothetical protein